MSERRSCRALGLSHLVLRRKPAKDAQVFLLNRITEITSMRISTDPCPVASGGLGGQPQAGLPALQGGRVEPAPPELAKKGRGAAG